MEIAVKNMVCSRCVKVVNQVLDTMHIAHAVVTLGHISFQQELSKQQYDDLKTLLEAEGFALAENEKSVIAEQVKNLVIDLVYNKELSDFNFKLSAYLSAALHKDYSMISQVFSALENTTVEQFFILQKLERVKEMLVYDQDSLSNIAWKMGYSSVAHLSAQFKKMTGFTPSGFKALKAHKKVSIDHLK
ncbi:AraC family transcriptional regulator [Panacibacter sp. DH6]|uniref:AraC family transcriptional regulator n=1 Tax=Panacibacter microcysteis TaxID=2793269 RepID=A0A931GZ43_9BACT|nr:helix-turn-helix domain-containing protein [Panacibacter microcysteis]MBG9378029.1 AraC family transcriptional regulator [Panacibacter microcysteis]